jgi:hypothetical protein
MLRNQPDNFLVNTEFSLAELAFDQNLGELSHEKSSCL